MVCSTVRFWTVFGKFHAVADFRDAIANAALAISPDAACVLRAHSRSCMAASPDFFQFDRAPGVRSFAP